MRAMFAALMFVATCSAAWAQDAAGLTLSGNGVVTAPVGDFAVSLSGPVAIITSNGDVRIDWAVAESIAAADPAKHDGTTRAIVALMIAIRDGTYKPMEKR